MAHLPAVGTIEAAAITKAAGIIKVVSLNIIPAGAITVILNKDLIPEVLLTLIHPDNILAGLILCADPAEGAGLILVARPCPGPDLMEDMVVVLGVITVQDPWTTSTPGMIPSHPRRRSISLSSS